MQRFQVVQRVTRDTYTAPKPYAFLRGTSAGIRYDSAIVKLKRKHTPFKWQQQPPSEALEVYLFPWEDSRVDDRERDPQTLQESIKVVSDGRKFLIAFFNLILS